MKRLLCVLALGLLFNANALAQATQYVCVKDSRGVLVCYPKIRGF